MEKILFIVLIVMVAVTMLLIACHGISTTTTPAISEDNTQTPGFSNPVAPPTTTVPPPTTPPPVSPPAPLIISTTVMPDGKLGEFYSQELKAVGGVPPYEWNIPDDSLSAGFSIYGSTITTVPTVAGTHKITVQVSDSAIPKNTRTQALMITINPRPLVINTIFLSDGQVGVEYSQVLIATGGVPPYRWNTTTEPLPSGLTLSGNTIIGNPTQAGVYTISVDVSDSGTTIQTTTQVLTIRI